MKKGVDVKIITGNIGIPKSEWHEADSYANYHTHFGDALLYIIKCEQERQNKVEDIDFIDVTNEPQHIAFLGHDLNSK
jgi:hypothetical protein